MKKIIISLVLIVCAKGFAQQEPQIAQYMYNPSVVNPAYAGSLGYGSLFSLYRTQWVGLEGAPKTVSLSYHQPIGLSNLGYGVSIIHDEIGPSTTSFAAVDISYTIHFENENRLAFGVKTGGNFLNINYNKLNHHTAGEQAFQNNINNQFSPNIGVGLYYYNANSYMGISVPMLLQTKVYNDLASSEISSRKHFYFMAGKVFDLAYNLKFKPSFVTKIVAGAPVQLDLTANFLFDEHFTVGASYRWNAAVSAMLGFKVTDRMAIGYGYDRETTRLANFNSGSHELFIQFDLFKINQRIETPRFF